MTHQAATRAILLILCALLLPAGCGDSDGGFRLLDAERTGIDFANTVTTSEAHDFTNDAFIYNGAGVAAGDVDGDGLPDLYLTGNMVSSRLYLNRGEMRFEDVTEAAGVGTDCWATGASMVDIDGDRDLDIYVSVAGADWIDPAARANLLFINRGDGTFTEEARQWGIADTGFTTHSIFLDYDRDGDLDVYLLGNSPAEFARGETGQPAFSQGSANPAGFDQLYENEGDGTFRNVSEEAGIVRRLGYGLGVVTADLNRDGWPDIYVSNDIAPNDVLYVNNGDGTFTDRAAEWLDHTSFAGMGIDIADFNNDGWPDIVQSDMMPPDLSGRKRVSGTSTTTALEALRTRGFFPQFNHNALQLNRGPAPDGRMIFSEVGRMAGIAYTDWSWAALFADYDNDGRKDILITNGYPKAVTDLDYQANSRMVMRLNDRRMSRQLAREMLDSLPGYEVANHVFRNEGDLTFSDRSREWRLTETAFSYGAAYVDLNNDGRLDLVVNNIDSPAFIYENTGPGVDEGAHYLQVKLEGEGANTGGLGAKLTLFAGDARQYVDHTSYRGFMSTVDDRIHFGLGETESVDSLQVIWPDGRMQVLRGVTADRQIELRQRDAVWPWEDGAGGEGKTAPRFAAADSALGPVYGHLPRGSLGDYELQPFLPYQLSRQGPPIVVGDVDGDSREDLFIGGTRASPGRLFLQRAEGGFTETGHPQPWAADSSYDDWGAEFFDADGDGLPDLYVASGGYHLAPGSRLLQDRLYLNRGQGRFVRAEGALPEMLTSTSSVEAGDFNGDGRMDLFVGGRLVPGNYPAPERSYLLRNDGGRFTDVTAEVAPGLLEPGGMVTAAVWMDFSGDGTPDLVTAGIWMPIRFYRNDGGRLRDVTDTVAPEGHRGWWYSLETGDLDGDGRPDLVAGNLGLNYSYSTDDERPFGVYAADFSEDRTTEVIFTQAIEGREYPYYGLALLGRDFPALQAAYPTIESFSTQSVREIFGAARLKDALHYQADTFASVWLRNEGDGGFTSHSLPPMAQIAPIRGIVIDDLDGDGNVDLLLAGNLREAEPNTAPADAGKGLWMRGDGQGGFTPVSPSASGFLAPHDARDLKVVNAPAGKIVVVGNYGGALQAYAVPN